VDNHFHATFFSDGNRQLRISPSAFFQAFFFAQGAFVTWPDVWSINERV